MQLGCDPEIRNRKGKTAADIIADATVWDTLISYVNRRNDLLASSPVAVRETSAVAPRVEDESTRTEETVVPSVESVPECIVCCENGPYIRFEPCGHSNACADCAPRMKKCLECHVLITSKISAGNFVF